MLSPGRLTFLAFAAAFSRSLIRFLSSLEGHVSSQLLSLMVHLVHCPTGHEPVHPRAPEKSLSCSHLGATSKALPAPVSY